MTLQSKYLVRGGSISSNFGSNRSPKPLSGTFFGRRMFDEVGKTPDSSSVLVPVGGMLEEAVIALPGTGGKTWDGSVMPDPSAVLVRVGDMLEEVVIALAGAGGKTWDGSVTVLQNWKSVCFS